MDILSAVAEIARRVWPHLAAVLALVLHLGSSLHIILTKQDGRAAIGWIGIVWLVPLLGPVLYVVFGINRIRRRAAELRRKLSASRITTAEMPVRPPEFQTALGADHRHLEQLARLVDRVTHRRLSAGNRVTPLIDGDAAYPAMLDAIDGAEQTIGLCTYIFDHDAAGDQFADALARAVKRGVAVRVLIDGAGARYSRPAMTGALRKRHVPVARFLRTVWPWRMPYLNLRNHRKLLIVDGRVGFTGGMNIRQGHVVGRSPTSPIHDVQFRVEGPVVRHMADVLAEDWVFTTGEVLEGEGWFPEIPPCGSVVARGISDGPDEELDKLPLVLLGALARAQESVTIVTPYFLPDEVLVRALQVAALRGVDVHIVLPRINNLPPVQWASVAHLGPVTEYGCRVTMTPGPFDHTKIMTVDETWSLIGSANWDPRSFRLNFEFNLEVYDRALAAELNELVQGKVTGAESITAGDLRRRPIWVRLRNSAARLFSPYL